MNLDKLRKIIEARTAGEWPPLQLGNVDDCTLREYEQAKHNARYIAAMTRTDKALLEVAEKACQLESFLDKEFGVIRYFVQEQDLFAALSALTKSIEEIP